MSLSVVLYAEGPGETKGARLPAPLEPLREEHWGPAHFLVRRAIQHARGVDEIRFLAPLPTRTGRAAKGSDLHSPPIVRKLLAFVRAAPDIAVLLVDADGDASGRRKALEGLLRDRAAVHAIAIQEFEAWLISDIAAAARVLGKIVDEAPLPEAMGRGDAKRLWADWTADLASIDRDARRRALTETIDLDTLARRSPSFARFLEDLRPKT